MRRIHHRGILHFEEYGYDFLMKLDLLEWVDYPYHLKVAKLLPRTEGILSQRSGLDEESLSYVLLVSTC